MSVAVALVLLSAFTHALWNALLRLEQDKDRALVLAIAFASLFASIVAVVRFALGQAAFPTTGSLAYTVLAGVLEWLYFWSLALALERGRLGVVYTVSRGGAVLGVYPLSIALFAEQLTTTSAIGSGVVLLGLAVTSLGTGDRRAGLHGGILWALVCAAGIAGYHLAYKAALNDHGGPSAVFAVSLAVASAINLVRVGARGRIAIGTLLRTRLLRIVLMGIICGGSFLLLMEALAGGGAGYVLTLRNTSVLFAVGLAFAIGERPRRPEIIGATLVAAGAVLMSLPS